jgi:hypothetical protein
VRALWASSAVWERVVGFEGLVIGRWCGGVRFMVYSENDAAHLVFFAGWELGRRESKRRGQRGSSAEDVPTGCCTPRKERCCSRRAWAL